MSLTPRAGGASAARLAIVAWLAGSLAALAALAGPACAQAVRADAPLPPPRPAAQARFDFDRTPGRLSKDVVPTRHALTLDLDPARDTFGGQATITLNVRRPVASLLIHAHELQALSAVLLPAAGAPRKLAIRADAKAQTWQLVPLDGRTIAAGEQRLELAWVGKVQRSGEALFRSDYLERGQPARMLATQLESVFARKVFPAFDEPSFRAVFEIAVHAPRGWTVQSNMPLAARTEDADGSGRELHRFEPTPPMPCYLVAVSVGRYDELAGEAAGVPLRILTAPGKAEQGRYALQVVQQVLPMYTEYFGLPYALPKLDLLAVPAGRDGAMEDWGLISYAEASLLFDPARSGPRERRWTYTIVAHEVAHQWFGNLVTAASWEEIWLNEAFATWMEGKATARFNPDWHVELQRRTPIDRTMKLDAGPATRAIRSGPVRESSVFDVFDDITYVKGGAVLSMLEQWIGVPAFRRGLAAYMAERRYSNATAGDLWFHLAGASGRDVSAVAASWTDQPGFPEVGVAADCVDGRTRVTLTQRRFVNAGADANAARARDARWSIPVRLARGAEAATVMLDGAQAQHEWPGCSDEPVLANAGGEGYYRVAYDADAHARLRARYTALAPADQIVLMSDTHALAIAGRLPMERWFELLALLPRVDGAGRAELYEMAGTELGQLDAIFAGTPAQAALRAAGRALYAPELARLGWVAAAGESAQAEHLRGTLVGALARWDDDATIARARELYALDQRGQAALAPSIRAAVLEAVGVHADRATFEQLLQRLREAESESDRWTYALALAAGRDGARSRELLAAALTGVAPPNIAAQIPALVAEQSPWGAQAYDFSLANWDALAHLAGSNWSGSSWPLPGAAQGFHEPARAAKLRADQRRKAGRDGDVPAARVSADIELAAELRRRDGATLERVLGGWRPAASVLN